MAIPPVLLAVLLGAKARRLSGAHTAGTV